MSSAESVIASGTIGLFTHSNGSWQPVKGDTQKKSTVSLFKNAKAGSFSLKVVLSTSSETLLSATLSKLTSLQKQDGYELFYLFYDGTKYWGLDFADVTVATIFGEHFNKAIEQISSSSKPLSSSSSSFPKANSSPSKVDSTSVSKKAAFLNSAVNSTSPRSTTSFSTSPVQKPSDNISTTTSKSFGGTPKTSKLNSPNRATGVLPQTPVSGEQTSTSAGAPKAPGSAPSNAVVSKLSFANRPSNSSAPNSPSDDSTLKSSPSSKSLQRPDVRKRSATSLHSSDDQVLHTKQSKAEKSQREKIIDEVLKTEEDYVDSLILVREKYILPLKYAPRLGVQIFKPGDLERMIYGLEPIYVLNTALLNELKQSKRDHTIYERCGTILNSYAPSMKLYIDYVNKYDNTIKMIKEYEDNNLIFKGFLAANGEDPESAGRGIRDFWIMPIQRIPRYALLMNELLKHTSDTHPDQLNIKDALSKFQEIAGYINNRKKDYDSQEKVALIQQRLNPKCKPVMKERRTFVFEGIVYIKNSMFIPPKKNIKVKKGKPEPIPEDLGLQEVEFFLFNDLLLWTSKDPKNPYLNELGRVPIFELIVCEERPHYTVPFYENTSNYKAFSIRTSEINEENAPVFYCTDPSTADKWIVLIKDTFSKAASARAAELDRLAKANMSSK